MKLQLTFLLATFASAFATEQPEGDTREQLRKMIFRGEPPEGYTPEQLRKIIGRRLQNGDDSETSTEARPVSLKDLKDLFCFSASNEVEVKGEGMVTMDSLKIGDYVRSGKEGEYSRVFSFIHYSPDEEGDFIKIHTEGNAPLEISNKHMVFRNDEAVKAEEVAVGDMLGDNKVTDITYTKNVGLYAPLTYDGSIVVNGVKASSYVAFLEHIPTDQQHFWHMFFALQRAACSVNFGLCERETYTHGLSAYSMFFFHFYAYTNTFSGPLPWFVEKSFCYITGPTWMILEQLIVSPILAMLSIGFLIYKSQPKKSKMA